MKLFKTLLTILFISLLSSPSWSETWNDSTLCCHDDLVFRDDLFYEKFTDVPFTGKVTGQYQGLIKNGERVGAWDKYYENGGLRYRGNFKNGRDGAWIFYYENGQLYARGNYKNGRQVVPWIYYNVDGTKFSDWLTED
jgi:hypothetical protein